MIVENLGEKVALVDPNQLSQGTLVEIYVADDKAMSLGNGIITSSTTVPLVRIEDGQAYPNREVMNKVRVTGECLKICNYEEGL